MRQEITVVLEQVIVNPKVAGLVGSTTAATSTFSYIQGGVSIFAIAAGAVLSLSLIIIHWQRWNADKQSAKTRLEMDMQLAKKEKERYALENKVLTLELKALKDNEK